MPEASNITKRIFSGKILEKRAARILAVQCIYSIISDKVVDKSTDEKVNDIISMYMNELSDSKFSKANHAYLIRLVRFAMDNSEATETNISLHLSKDWKIGRLPKVVLSILKCAVSELFLDKALDRQIIINDYLEIAKLFNHEGEVGFINSVLDKVAASR